MSANHHGECNCGACIQRRQAGEYAGLYGSCQCGSCNARGALLAAQEAPAKSPDGPLTFAEALTMCHERGTVEVREPRTGKWEEFFIDQSMGTHVNMDLVRVAELAGVQFRRSRPKRSRVEGIICRVIDLTAAPPLEPAILSLGPCIIRAVAAYIRDRNWSHQGAETIASDIEHAFLGSRS